MTVFSHKSCDLAGGGSAYGQQVVDSFPHFLHPGADLWSFRENLSHLLIVGGLDLHILFLKLGGCLRAAIGGASKVALRSGFFKIIALKCLPKMSFDFGSRGLKSMGAIIRFFFSSS